MTYYKYVLFSLIVDTSVVDNHQDPMVHGSMVRLLCFGRASLRTERVFAIPAF